MSENPLLVVKGLADAYNRKDWGAFAALLHSEAVFESPDLGDGVERYQGVDAIVEFVQAWIAVVPDDTVTFSSTKIVGNDRVVCEVTWSGTHSGEPFEWQDIVVPARGNAFVNRGNTEYTVRNGKIIRIIDRFDVTGFLAGFGINPP